MILPQSRESPAPIGDGNTTDSTDELVIGVDFGTTFTGVAYTRSPVTSNYSRNPDAETHLVTDWPNVNSQSSEKTPTALAYREGEPIAWGGMVKPNQPGAIRYFKLGLEEGSQLHQGRNTLISASSHDSLRGEQGLFKSPVEYVTDYLSLVREHIHNRILPDHYDNAFLENHSISYALTVPAIWKDKAKELMHEAAMNAGIPMEKFQIITEPEAAALYCATSCRVEFTTGDRFLVCDAGGGTVDLIAYEVVRQTPFEINECTAGTGGACGSIFLDKNFELLLRSKIGAGGVDVDRILTPRRLEEAMRSFTDWIKCQFNPFSRQCETEFEIPIVGAPDIEAIGLEDGFLKIYKDEIETQIFQPIFDQIVDLVKAQIERGASQHPTGITTVFLVGGLGMNEYLRQYLETKISPQIRIRKPGFGLTAVARGAVMHKLGINYVKERVLRRHYGTVVSKPFIEGVHPESSKCMYPDGVLRCTSVMLWYVNKGQKIPDGYTATQRIGALVSEAAYSSRRLEHTVVLKVCEEEEAPEYNTDDSIACQVDVADGIGLPTLCSVIGDLKRIPDRAYKMSLGHRGTYYYLEFEIAMIFRSTLEFRFLFEGEVLGTAAVNYV